MSYDAVLLLAFGGPERMQDVRPFLRNVLANRGVLANRSVLANRGALANRGVLESDPDEVQGPGARTSTPQRIPEARFEEVVSHYARFGGCSPLNRLTTEQAAALEREIEERGLCASGDKGLPVRVGMRNWSPYIADVLHEMRDAGHRSVLALIMSSLETEASVARYRAAVAEARLRLGQAAPEVDFAGGFHAAPGLVQTHVDHIREALARLPPGERQTAKVAFTAHSIPKLMADQSPYVAQFESCARAVAAALGHARCLLCYQSRSGRADEPWLEPDVNDALRTHAQSSSAAIVLAPIGFVCDHIEVLYDLDVQAAATANRLGLSLLRASTPNTHPAFVSALADLVQRSMQAR
ncbi:MAG: ferrochelatase [Proteobacteria bacterium]|nr:ferrochelatase [Pseudomonadota bacterium]